MPEVSKPAVPQVKWADSWGAIAIDDIRGEAGIVTGFPSKRKAKKAAIEECRKRGGEDCSISIIYTNQCAAVVSNSVMSSSANRSEEHTSELPSLMRISYAVFCLKKKKEKHKLLKFTT